MPEKRFIIPLSPYAQIVIYFETSNGEVVKFVVKLLYLVNNKWFEIQRYDCFHDVVHKDILNLDGEKIKTKKYPLVNLKSGINMAITDFKENYKTYIWKFVNHEEE